MNILGIETSCDETSASVVKNGQTVLSNITLSSLKQHSQYGGVIPEIASRKQIELIYPVVKEALKTANTSLKKIDAVAVTQSPGLVGSLLVGTSFAKSLSFATGKPLIKINHIHAHLYANWLKRKGTKEFNKPKLPAIGLVVSGGHTVLFKVSKNFDFTLLGQTRDDAIGEAYDKVAKMLDLGYPGGPVIDKLARKSPTEHIDFKCAQLPGSLDFSFSGIKTGVLYYLKKHPKTKAHNLAYGFQKSAINRLVKKTIQACLNQKLNTIVIGGGVAANSHLRELLSEESKKNNINLFIPEFEYCLDNAAMIAGYAYQKFNKAS